jgi:hypothetical protein
VIIVDKIGYKFSLLIPCSLLQGKNNYQPFRVKIRTQRGKIPIPVASYRALRNFEDFHNLLLIISFLLTRGREKVNHNGIFWQIKNPSHRINLNKGSLSFNSLPRLCLPPGVNKSCCLECHSITINLFNI